MNNKLEILAPAGRWDTLEAAVRCGANAVYLGGTDLNARAGAKNFDKALLKKAVSYCHARGVAVHMTLNTVVFESELSLVEKAVKEAADAGVDAFIIQDLGVLEIAKNCAPDIERHASTQMAVHNLEGILALEKLGFSRVVLARELSFEEIEYICKQSPLEVECFVHGALCMSVSGQCYLSSMIGGRSGNRGRCAQPCRLPFSSGAFSNALSLKDLSAIEDLPALAKAGVTSFKIEGRLKRPEYVGAAVTAANDILSGKTPDYHTLESVFSRSGFTDGYLHQSLGDSMFGTRTKDDVASTAAALKELAGLYKDEPAIIPLKFYFTLRADTPSELTVVSEKHSITAIGDVPETAKTSPTTYEKALKSFSKTGGTPFYLESLNAEIDEGLILPASGLNALRREALEALLEEMESVQPKKFSTYNWGAVEYSDTPKATKFRGRFEKLTQLWSSAYTDLDMIILPVEEVLKNTNLDRDKTVLELPRVTFSRHRQIILREQLEEAAKLGYKHICASGLDAIQLGRELGFSVHGDFPLNVTNHIAFEKYAEIPLSDITMSIEYGLNNKEPVTTIPKGIVAYGYLPMMIYRNHPAGLKGDGTLTDRLGNDFPVRRKSDYSVMYNSVPLYLGDKLKDFSNFDFLTLYFTDEHNCEEIYKQYINSSAFDGQFTRGLYARKVL